VVGEVTVRLCPELQLKAGRELTETELQGVDGARMLAALPLVLVICQYSEDLSWLSKQPFPWIVYDKNPLSSMGGTGK
jgi:hypothetical protein